MGNFSYVIIYILLLATLIVVAIYVYKSRKKIDEMHGMMIGMTLGMMAGLATATIFLIPTGNFLNGVIIGSIMGILFGVPFGKLGGHLGMLEGVVAGPMGGMMGAMLGQMIRPFNLEIFIPFFVFIFLITAMGITYAVNCGVSCCSLETNQKVNQYKLSKKFILFWTLIVILFLGISVFLPFPLGSNRAKPSISSNAAAINKDEITLPLFLQKLIKEERREAIIKNSEQEIDLQITASAYSPNVIIAQKDIPLKIKVSADKNAGCAREIIFPDFNVNRIIPAGGSATIEINPVKEGTFIFRCSMDMVRGKLIITK